MFKAQGASQESRHKAQESTKIQETRDHRRQTTDDRPQTTDKRQELCKTLDHLNAYESIIYESH